MGEMFSRIAARYDLMNGLMTLGMHHAWRRQVARQSIPAPEGPLLDLATGTGDLALALREAHPHRLVVAADFSIGMLREAERKLAAVDPPPRVPLVAADALALPFGDRTFACVTSAFLLRNLADLGRGLAEMKRVTRPGGRVVALEITQARLPGFAPLFRVYFNRIVPRLGRLVSGDAEAYTYLPQSVEGFLGPEELRQAMQDAGLRGVSYRTTGMGTITIHTGIA
ncbi:MAG TPA: ubiquinone/menaquinone biosynthesis methyltransferase [Candidatus Binatia bacterium]|nr:ubiquinone/menaquinone biosynthesis methyltransferase [Candidatus Binatia bacterium]